MRDKVTLMVIMACIPAASSLHACHLAYESCCGHDVVSGCVDVLCHFQ